MKSLRRYFEPISSPVMASNYGTDLGAPLQVPHDGDCSVDAATEVSEVGKFGWVMGPVCIGVGLWEPPPEPAAG